MLLASVYGLLWRCCGRMVCKRETLRETQPGSTAMILAALAGKIDCVRLLVEGGACINAQDYVRKNISIHKLQSCSYFRDLVFNYFNFL